jgi:hypothetical protein
MERTASTSNDLYQNAATTPFEKLIAHNNSPGGCRQELIAWRTETYTKKKKNS